MHQRFINLGPGAKAVIIFTIFIVLALAVPELKTPINASGVLAAASVFYSILLGFYIAAAMTNLSRLKTLVAIETGALIAIYNFVKLALPERLEATRNAIDDYLIKRFNYEVHNYDEPTTHEFFAIFDVLKGAHAKSDGEKAAIDYIAEGEYYVSQARRETTIVGARIVTPVSWFVLIVLSVVIIVCLFIMQTSSVTSHFITALLSASAVSALFILDDVDGNRFGEDQFAINTYQDVFHAMGEMAYYPKDYLEDGRYQPQEREYRVGHGDDVVVVKQPKPRR